MACSARRAAEVLTAAVAVPMVAAAAASAPMRVVPASAPLPLLWPPR
jgi:hypothetical protein